MSDFAPFTATRVFEAPRELVFDVHTDPRHLAKWFGPEGTVVIKSEMDLRAGGSYHYGLRIPDGHEMWGKQTYIAIVAPEKLVFIQSFSDPDGGVARHPMSPTWPLEMMAVTTFEDLEGKTRLTVTWQPHNATDNESRTFDSARIGMEQGFCEMFDGLETYLESLRER